MMTNIYALKDEKMFCPECLKHYLTFNQAIFVGQIITTETVYQDKGQAPFKQSDPIACKNCGFYLGDLNKLIKEKGIN